MQQHARNTHVARKSTAMRPGQAARGWMANAGHMVGGAPQQEAFPSIAPALPISSSSSSSTGGRRQGPGPPSRKPRKHGVLALREIREYQKSTALLLKKVPFRRLVRQIVASVADEVGFPGVEQCPVRIKLDAINGLQEAAEMYLYGSFELANLAAIHARRVTIQPRDLELVCRIRGEKSKVTEATTERISSKLDFSESTP